MVETIVSDIIQNFPKEKEWEREMIFLKKLPKQKEKTFIFEKNKFENQKAVFRIWFWFFDTKIDKLYNKM